jgi:hypothetical protein
MGCEHIRTLLLEVFHFPHCRKKPHRKKNFRLGNSEPREWIIQTGLGTTAQYEGWREDAPRIAGTAEKDSCDPGPVTFCLLLGLLQCSLPLCPVGSISQSCPPAGM